MAQTVYVDRVAPGSAIVVAGDRQARVGRDGTRFYIEDADSEERIGTARTYRDAGRVAAKAWGITDYEVSYEDETRYSAR